MKHDNEYLEGIRTFEEAWELILRYGYAVPLWFRLRWIGDVTLKSFCLCQSTSGESC